MNKLHSKASLSIETHQGSTSNLHVQISPSVKNSKTPLILKETTQVGSYSMNASKRKQAKAGAVKTIYSSNHMNSSPDASQERIIQPTESQLLRPTLSPANISCSQNNSLDSSRYRNKFAFKNHLGECSQNEQDLGVQNKSLLVAEESSSLQSKMKLDFTKIGGTLIQKSVASGDNKFHDISDRGNVPNQKINSYEEVVQARIKSQTERGSIPKRDNDLGPVRNAGDTYKTSFDNNVNDKSPTKKHQNATINHKHETEKSIHLSKGANQSYTNNKLAGGLMDEPTIKAITGELWEFQEDLKIQKSNMKEAMQRQEREKEIVEENMDTLVKKLLSFRDGFYQKVDHINNCMEGYGKVPKNHVEEANDLVEESEVTDSLDKYASKESLGSESKESLESTNTKQKSSITISPSKKAFLTKGDSIMDSFTNKVTEQQKHALSARNYTLQNDSKKSNEQETSKIKTLQKELEIVKTKLLDSEKSNKQMKSTIDDLQAERMNLKSNLKKAKQNFNLNIVVSSAEELKEAARLTTLNSLSKNNNEDNHLNKLLADCELVIEDLIEKVRGLESEVRRNYQNSRKQIETFLEKMSLLSDECEAYKKYKDQSIQRHLMIKDSEINTLRSKVEDDEEIIRNMSMENKNLQVQVSKLLISTNNQKNKTKIFGFDSRDLVGNNNEQRNLIALDKSLEISKEGKTETRLDSLIIRIQNRTEPYESDEMQGEYEKLMRELEWVKEEAKNLEKNREEVEKAKEDLYKKDKEKGKIVKENNIKRHKSVLNSDRESKEKEGFNAKFHTSPKKLVQRGQL